KNSSRGSADTDEDEFINTIVLPIDKVFQMMMEGQIKDAKTIVAFLLARTRGLL
ncbi:MAG TPA: ADP-ribose pyrophosphatase, partial [Firmicutes bacterium]|nr:ADP-ribose pyrophosphatase [Bacillota bacterium]